jgi:hypothetical protein
MNNCLDIAADALRTVSQFREIAAGFHQRGRIVDDAADKIEKIARKVQGLHRLAPDFRDLEAARLGQELQRLSTDALRQFEAIPTPPITPTAHAPT